MRISDADRAEIAERLAKHYGDGRLDQAEFERRLDKAMHATTVADLTGLLADLPGDPLSLPTEPRAPRNPQEVRREQRELRHQRRPAGRRALRWIALIVAFVFLAGLAARAIAELVFVCLVVAVVALLLKLFHRPSDRGGS